MAVLRTKGRWRGFRLASALESYWRIVDAHPELVDPNGAGELVKGMDDFRVRWCGIPSAFQ